MKILETNRLILREFEYSDAPDLLELNSDPAVMKYTGDPPFSNVFDAETFLQNYDAYNKYGFGRWAAISKDSGNFLGWCGLKLNEHNLVDIGFRFFQNEWGKGYATEAAQATLEYGFIILDIEEIIGRAARENKASIRVLEKLGMTFWKKDSCKGIENSLYYKISRDQYNNS